MLAASWGALNSLIKCVLRAAARLVTGFSKFDHVSHYMRDVLHWLPVSQRIQFGISVWVWHCHLWSAPAYLREFCGPTSGLAAQLFPYIVFRRPVNLDFLLV